MSGENHLDEVGLELAFRWRDQSGVEDANGYEFAFEVEASQVDFKSGSGFAL